MGYDSPRQARRREKLRNLIGTDQGAQAALAREIGTPRSHISAILAGNRGIGDELAAKIERHLGKPAGWFDSQDEAAWPFSKELRQKVLGLQEEELLEAENLLRWRLSMLPINASDFANSKQVSSGPSTQDSYADSREEDAGEWEEHEVPASNKQHGSRTDQRPTREKGRRSS